MADIADMTPDYSEMMLAKREASRKALVASADTECSECGDPIGAARKQSLPHTSYCVGCAGVKEVQERGRGY